VDADWLHHVCRGAGAAVAAGVAHLGIHRNVIHPRFGSFVLLGTVLLDAEASAYDQPLADNPCLACKLCVAACLSFPKIRNPVPH
jgi:epoxyqueuosine reductase QueG